MSLLTTFEAASVPDWIIQGETSPEAQNWLFWDWPRNSTSQRVYVFIFLLLFFVLYENDIIEGNPHRWMKRYKKGRKDSDASALSLKKKRKNSWRSSGGGEGSASRKCTFWSGGLQCAFGSTRAVSQHLSEQVEDADNVILRPAAPAHLPV